MTGADELLAIVHYHVLDDTAMTDARVKSAMKRRKPGELPRQYADEVLKLAQLAHPASTMYQACEHFIATISTDRGIWERLAAFNVFNTSPSIDCKDVACYF